MVVVGGATGSLRSVDRRLAEGADVSRALRPHVATTPVPWGEEVFCFVCVCARHGSSEPSPAPEAVPRLRGGAPVLPVSRARFVLLVWSRTIDCRETGGYVARVPARGLFFVGLLVLGVSGRFGGGIMPAGSGILGSARWDFKNN